MAHFTNSILILKGSTVNKPKVDLAKLLASGSAFIYVENRMDFDDTLKAIRDSLAARLNIIVTPFNAWELKAVLRVAKAENVMIHVTNCNMNHNDIT